ERREQSRLVARRKDDCLYERDESGGSGQAGKEKEEGRGTEESGGRDITERFARSVKAFNGEKCYGQERFRRSYVKSGSRISTRERRARNYARSLPRRQ